MNLFRYGMRLAVLGACLSGLALADPFIDFAINVPTAGSISYAGGANPLVGSGIQVDTVVGSGGTPLNNDVVRNCLSCTLNFTTGNFTGFSSPTTYTFANGGTLTLSGTVDLNNNGYADAGDASGTLLSGFFSGGTPYVVATTFLGNTTFNIAGALFSTFVNNTLASFYGLPTAPFSYYGGFNISFLGVNTGSGFTSTSMGSGDVIAATPEPFSIILMGTTLMLFAMIWRRRLAKRLSS